MRKLIIATMIFVSGRALRQLCAGRHARWWHARARITCPHGPGESDRPAISDARCSPHRKCANSTPSSADSGRCFFAPGRAAQADPRRRSR